MGALRFIIIAAVCISIFYLAYLAFLKKETNFRNLRFYLLGSIVLSLLIPLNTYRINTGITLMKERSKEVTVLNTEFAVNTVTDDLTPEKSRKLQVWWNEFTSILHRGNIFVMIYLAVVGALLLRIALQITILFTWIIRSEKVIQNNCTLLYNRRFKNTFSFFRWIFICEGFDAHGDMKQIIDHEKTHANQYHSLDLLLMELLTAVLWFNPLVWMMKNSMLLVHEYLADEGALKSGVDPLRYQVLLLNQVAEEKLICLSSSFSSARLPGKYSLIKKRMIMMTTNKITKEKKSRLLTMIPVSASLVFALSIFNGLSAGNSQSKKSDPGALLSSLENTVFEDLIRNDAKDTTKKSFSVEAVSSEKPADTIKMQVEITHIKSDASSSNEGEVHKVIVTEESQEPVKNMNDVVVIGYAQDSSKTKVQKAQIDSSGKKIAIRMGGQGNDENQAGIKKIKTKPSRNPLLIIDGIEHPEDDAIANLDPKKIERLEVFTGEAIKKFTNKDCDGVIIITTKKE